MHSPAPEIVAGYPTGCVADKDPNPETTLGSAYSPVDYMSITSFPRLPEDDMLSGENTLRSRKDDDNVLSEQETDPDLFLKSARLQRLPSSASDLASHDIASLQETNRDPFTEDCACQRDGLTVIITACLTFATGVTVALIMQIYFGDPQVFNQGAVVTDVAQCTSLGFEVLMKQGSSVDAAITAALCLGIVNPHTSGIGGGGVMLVHDIRKNETRVIDFRETAPSAIYEEMLQKNLSQNPGRLVGVPGMLSGMHQAHQLYGRMPWEDVVTMAADVARNGFNVTHDLAEALAIVKDQNMSAAFRDLFLPNGHAPLPGQSIRRLDLAAILDAVAVKGISEFYSGNLTQEMAVAVQARGGVLTEDDFGNYSTVLQQPAEIIYQGHHVMTASAPHAGVALITALNILEGYNITGQLPRNSTYHWIAEAVKIALGLASGLGDPMYDPAVSEIVAKMLSKSQASLLRQIISDSQTFPVNHYTPSFTLVAGAAAAQVMVMGPDDHIVSVMSSLNKPFGSGIVTPSGILLNSQILDFSWPNETQSSSPNPHNSVRPGKRPMSFLMPTVVRPAVGLCGTYVAVGSSNEEKALSGITQVLMNVLSLRKNMSDSVAYGRLHPQLQPDILLVDSEFLDEDMELLQAKGHKVQKVDVLSLVEGTRRTNDLIIGVKDPRSADASALTMSNIP
ncbi:glutathione hydrolase 7 [Micropterus salmoides]|uniref:glutathione hydrolase 7 n=1 Tax=Micropterus salmoides TaxID=27706 RepID=UPI0018EA55B6|nr:glutathione hydrolase 7 [Micropterus salmoides]XP_038578364.1 glutathione hydrolase 7 [Micropterus salmoides]XP_038578365.1 glutathione hydrolase 7 [Micropterus salmoides]XP_038578366.1 glutathione hydrolase 7 [Micropterus salmoides]XP_038578367.1 glutathione hydrolase 7 [Micropterus salmoides]XP_038578368.1 glutathione hydrolase 7 [Micropterus salmoides]XP_038578369.1 glutathione hydrolase 7 [Micropterus salmoides]